MARAVLLLHQEAHKPPLQSPTACQQCTATSHPLPASACSGTYHTPEPTPSILHRRCPAARMPAAQGTSTCPWLLYTRHAPCGTHTPAPNVQIDLQSAAGQPVSHWQLQQTRHACAAANACSHTTCYVNTKLLAMLLQHHPHSVPACYPHSATHTTCIAAAMLAPTTSHYTHIKGLDPYGAESC
jgi:hypothetical protein